MSLTERLVQVADLVDGVSQATVTVTADVTNLNLNDIGASDTFTLTPTRVDTATAGTATGAITYHATEATFTGNIQTAIQALGGIYADATVANGTTAAHKNITVNGGYDVTWAVGSPTTFTPGAVTETTAGSVAYTCKLPVGRFAKVKRIRLTGFNDNNLDVAITDQDSLTVFSKTGLDTSTTEADTEYLKYLCADGVAGEDGAAAANVVGGIFEGPLNVTITTSAPVAARAIEPTLGLVVEAEGSSAKRFLQRSSGALSALSGTFSLGAPFVIVRKIKILSSADNSVAPTLTDADGMVIYTKTSTDYTTAVVAQLGHEGIDQAANAVADTLDVVAKSPITVSGSGLGSGTVTFTLWCEA